MTKRTQSARDLLRCIPLKQLEQDIDFLRHAALKSEATDTNVVEACVRLRQAVRQSAHGVYATRSDGEIE